MSAPNVLESLGDLDRLAFALEVMGENQFQRGDGWQRFCVYCHVHEREHDHRCKLTEWLDEVYVLLDEAANAGQGEPEPTSDEVWEPLPVTEESICKHCGGQLAIANPKGFCNHIYYPDYCEVCAAISVDDFTEIVELRGGNRNGGLVRVTPGARELVDDGRYVITDERNVAGRRIARPRGRHK
jgi:hypothetical protein